MTATYTDIIEAMADAIEDGKSVDMVILTDESMSSFLADDNFSESTEQRQQKTIGEDWTLPIESGDSDVLVLETGERIEL